MCTGCFAATMAGGSTNRSDIGRLCAQFVTEAAALSNRKNKDKRLKNIVLE